MTPSHPVIGTALGCGLGGLPWNDVRALIWEYLEGSTCDIRGYTPPLRVIVAGSRTIQRNADPDITPVASSDIGERLGQ